MEVDMISQLPEDILISIITHFLTKEAVRTSILSKSWRNIYKFVPSIDIACHCCLKRYVGCNFEVIMNALRGLSQLHSGFIIFFKFHCCLSQSYSRAFEESMYSLGKHIEKLDARFTISPFKKFIFPCDLLSHMPSLKYLRLRYCILQPNFSSHFHSLKTLRLSSVMVAPGSLECLLSNCLSLTMLLIRNCNLPEKLCLRGPQLRCIKIIDWTDLREVELHAANLIVLELFDPTDILFGYVPQLQHVYLPSFRYFRTLAKDMPLLKSIHLQFDDQLWDDEDIQRENVFKEGFLFNNVKRLELNLFLSTYHGDLLSLMPLLHCCPVLQEFHMELLGSRRCSPWEKSIVAHRELKKVVICGFIDELELVSYILRSAVSLQQLYVSWFCNRYDGFGQWWEDYTYLPNFGKETIEKWLGRIRALEPLAASKTVQVVTEISPRRRRSKHDEFWADEPS